MNPQTLANESGQKVYAYRMDDFSIEHSFKYCCVGDKLNGKVVKELLGAYTPKTNTVIR